MTKWPKFRISLARLLQLLTAMCVVFAVIGWHYGIDRQELRAAEELEELGGWAEFRQVHSYWFFPRSRVCILAHFSGIDAENAQVEEIVRRLPALETLNVSRTKIGQSGWKRVGQCKRLKVLWASRLEDTRGIGEIGNCQLLESMMCESPGISDEDIIGLARCTSLRSLHVSFDIVSEEAATKLAALPNLHSIVTFGTVSDLALSKLARSTSIKELTIEQCDMSEGAAKLVASMPQLDDLAVGGVSSARAIETLDAAKSLTYLEINRKDYRVPRTPDGRYLSGGKVY